MDFGFPPTGFVTGANFVIDGGMTRKMIYDGVIPPDSGV